MVKILFNTNMDSTKNKKELEKLIRWFRDSEEIDNIRNLNYESVELVFRNFLLDKTNLMKELEKNLLTLNDIDYRSMLREFNKYGSDNLQESLLNDLSNKVTNFIKNNDIKTFTILCVSNIEKIRSYNEKRVFKKLFDGFKNISYVDVDYLNNLKLNKSNYIKYEEILDIIKNSNLECFCIELEGRSYNYIRTKYFLTEAFWGYMFFNIINNSRIDIDTNKFSNDYSFFDIHAATAIIYDEANNCYNVNYFLEDTVKQGIKDFKTIVYNKKLNINEKKLIEYNISLKKMSDSNYNNFINFCLIYFAASSQKNINYSFLNFWMLCETILKSNSKLSDEKIRRDLLKTHKNLTIWPTPLKMNEVINILYKKRNYLVHNGKHIINQYDRIMIKEIADALFEFFLLNSSRFKYDDYEEYFNNINTDINQLKSKQNVLDILINEKDRNRINELILNFSNNN